MADLAIAPASPTYVRHVEVNVRMFNYSMSQWNGDAGPGIMVTYLLRLLGGFFEYGPQFLGRPLERPLYLETLILSVVQVPTTPGNERDTYGDDWRHPSQDAMYRSFALELLIVQRSGLLFGRAKMLKLRCDGRDDMEWNITHQGDEDTIRNAREWAPYG